MSEIFTTISFLLNSFIGRTSNFKEKSLVISAEILSQLRKILILIIISFGSLAIFLMATNYQIDRVLNNLDKGQIIFAPSIGVLLVIQLFCVVIIMYATQKNKWQNIIKHEVPPPPQPHPNHGQLESVISLLILDIIKDRESKRSTSAPIEEEK